MGVSFVAASTFESFYMTKSAVPLTLPSGTAAGDVLIAQVAAFGNPVSLAAPSGWTLIRSDHTTTMNVQQWSALYYRVAGGSEPASYSFTLGNSSLCAGGLAAYRGVKTAAPVDAHAGVTATSTTSITAPAATSSGSGKALRLFSSYSRPWSSPSGQVVRYKVGAASGDDDGVMMCDADVTGGSVGTVSATTPAAYDATAQTVVLAGANAAPNAPTLTSPADNATIDRGIVQRFAWNFSDPDAGDSQSKYDLQYRAVGGTTWTAITGTTPNTYRDFAAGTFAAGNYEWQVRTYDSQGVVGPWSASSFFTAADAPAPATITAPTSGATVSSTATLTWSAPNQADYQWRRVKDNAGSADTSTVYYDSGDVVSSTTRSVMVTFDTNNRWEHLQVRVKYNGLWSAWSDVRIQVSYTPPPSPTFTLAPDNTAGSPTQGSILVAITNPAPGTGQPAVSYNEVYVTDPGKSEERRATNVATNGTWRYWTPPDGFDGTTVGHVRVVAVATNGTTAST